MREHEWINTPEARQRRSERSLFAIDDVLHALRNGRPAPELATETLREVSRETARAHAWRMLDRLCREDPPNTLPEPLVEPRQHGWDEDPRTAARYDRAWFDRDED